MSASQFSGDGSTKPPAIPVQVPTATEGDAAPIAAEAPAPTNGNTFQPGMGRQSRRVEGPRRIKNGLRLRRKEGIENLPWPASAWLTRIDGGLDPTIRAEGLEYARAGQAASLTITPGLVEAVMQGRAPRPYRVRVEVATLSGQEWERIVAIMAAEAIWSAKLLSGELPMGVEALFRSLDRTLVPERDAELRTTCTCTQFSDFTSGSAPDGPPVVCKHVSATWALVMERIDIDPLLSFTLRGLDGQRLLERLQEARAIATRGVSRAHSTPPVAEAAPALPPVERCLQDFWKPGRRLGELEELHPEEHVRHALLRRLGPSPFQANANRASHIQAAPAKGMPAAPLPAPNANQPTSKFPLFGLLASIYDSIAEASKKMRDADG
ncbi:MAG: hypothetical protein JNL80_10785 [Phycisphaerae bacterium]|nr:hypothetical protein [Phycisphaerae bacterium]